MLSLIKNQNLCVHTFCSALLSIAGARGASSVCFPVNEVTRHRDANAECCSALAGTHFNAVLRCGGAHQLALPGLSFLTLAPAAVWPRHTARGPVLGPEL